MQRSDVCLLIQQRVRCVMASSKNVSLSCTRALYMSRKKEAFPT